MVDNPSAAEAAERRRSILDSERRTFDASGIVNIVEGIRDLLPDGTEIVYDDGRENNTTPRLTVSGPEKDGTIDIMEEKQGRLVRADTIPARKRTQLEIKTGEINPSTIEFYVWEKAKSAKGNSSEFIDADYVLNVEDSNQVKPVLKRVLRRTFKFSPERSRKIEKKLFPPTR